MKTFSVVWKSRKAWKKLFGYGLKVCILNSFIIMRTINPNSKQEFITYPINIARQLITGQSFRTNIVQPPSRPLSEMDTSRLNGLYHPLEFTDTRIDCVVCAKVVKTQELDRNQQSKSAVMCTTCKDPLCVNSQRSCWNAWHTKVKYWNFN